MQKRHVLFLTTLSYHCTKYRLSPASASASESAFTEEAVRTRASSHCAMVSSSRRPACLQSATTSEADPPSEQEAPAFEQKHVHTVYSIIAPHFSATRHSPWPQVLEFLCNLSEHSLVADIGCGNGKYLIAMKRLQKPVHFVGVDSCPELCTIASSNVSQTLNESEIKDEQVETDSTTEFHDSITDIAVGDALAPPFRDGTFDAAISIAVTHHFSTRARRVAAHESLARLLRPGGLGLIYVWANERPHSSTTRRPLRGTKKFSDRFLSQDMLVPWHLRTRMKGATDDRILGDWHAMHRRYYHIYVEGELEHELSQVATLSVRRIYYDHQNWCAIVEKV